MLAEDRTCIEVERRFLFHRLRGLEGLIVHENLRILRHNEYVVEGVSFPQHIGSVHLL